jgi:hypothetical protein
MTTPAAGPPLPQRLARTAYESFARSIATGPSSGKPFADYADLSPVQRTAWESAAAAVREYLTEIEP